MAGKCRIPVLILPYARKLWVAAGFYLSPHHFYIRLHILWRVEGVHQPVGDGEIPFGRHRLEGGVDVLPALDCQQQLPRFRRPLKTEDVVKPLGVFQPQAGAVFPQEGADAVVGAESPSGTIIIVWPSRSRRVRDSFAASGWDWGWPPSCGTAPAPKTGTGSSGFWSRRPRR